LVISTQGTGKTEQNSYYGRPYDNNDRPLLTYLLTYVLLLSFLYSFSQHVISGVPRSLATKLSHMLVTECNLRNPVRNLGRLTLKILG